VNGTLSADSGGGACLTFKMACAEAPRRLDHI